MRILSSELTAHLASGATHLCTAWAITRGDGVMLGFTDHDNALVFEGIRFEAVGGFTSSAMDVSGDLSADNVDVAGVLTSAGLDEADIETGLFDGARVDIWWVKWDAPGERVLLRSGRIGEITRTETGFVAEVRGLSDALSQRQGRAIQAHCDADLGDERCGVDLAAAEFAATARVTALRRPAVWQVAGLDAFASDWFREGWLRFDGDTMRHRIKGHQVSGSTVLVEVWEPPARAVAVGAEFEISAGCDKRYATCRAKFANGVNFRGFPHVPGADFVTYFPRAGAINDGGSWHD